MPHKVMLRPHHWISNHPHSEEADFVFGVCSVHFVLECKANTGTLTNQAGSSLM